MPQNKRILFPLDDQYTSRYAQALCHPARLRIIEMMRTRLFMMHQAVEESLPLSASTVSQHLACLEGVGILEKSVVSGVVVYQLDREGLHAAKIKIEGYLARVG